MKYKHFVTLGEVDHGKSTLVGRLLWDMDKVGERTKEFCRSRSAGRGLEFAFLLDQKKSEQDREMTLDVGHNKLVWEGYSFTFSDVPGHEELVEKAHGAVCQAQVVLLVIAVDQGLQPQTRHHARYAREHGLTEAIVVMTKMDKIHYAESSFCQVENQMKKENVWPESKMTILPVSALAGENITCRSNKMPWFSGPSFLEALKTLAVQEAGLEVLVQQTEKILQEAVQKFKKPVMLWAGGKDSTIQLFLARQCLGGQKKLPFPVLFIDTTYKFPETYDFIHQYAQEWNLDLQIVKNQEALEKGVNPWTVSHFDYCHELKTKPLLKAIQDYGFDGVFVAIRWDEQGIRGKETYFSERESPSHTRIHPLLHWSEKEIWSFIRDRHVPYNPLYDKEDPPGFVYRSLGCWPFTKPISKEEPEERAGRELDKERLMEDLRALGYM